jgi:hypothetical protein
MQDRIQALIAVLQTFLEAHQGELAARVKREVRNKLRTGRKSGKPS